MANREIKTPESGSGPCPQTEEKENDSEGSSKSDSPLKPCTVCDVLTKTSCCGCNVIFYCSKACQKSDWNSHKTICKALANPPTKPVDGDQKYVLAFYFPQDSSKATMIYVPVSSVGVDDTALFLLIGPFTRYLSSSLPDSESSFNFIFRRNANTDGSLENKSLKKINNNIKGPAKLFGPAQLFGPALLLRTFTDMDNFHQPLTQPIFDVEPKDFALFFKGVTLGVASRVQNI